MPRIRTTADTGTTDPVEAPENPTAQNAATQAQKKPTTLPQVQTMTSTPATAETAPDPNAYAKPPQANQQATEANVAASNGLTNSLPPVQAIDTHASLPNPDGSRPSWMDEKDRSDVNIQRSSVNAAYDASRPESRSNVNPNGEQAVAFQQGLANQQVGADSPASGAITYTPIDAALQQRFDRFQRPGAAHDALIEQYKQQYGNNWYQKYADDADATLAEFNAAQMKQGVDPAMIGADWRRAYGAGYMPGRGQDPSSDRKEMLTGWRGDWLRSLSPEQQVEWFRQAMGPTTTTGEQDMSKAGFGNAYESGPFSGMSYGQQQMLMTLAQEAGIDTSKWQQARATPAVTPTSTAGLPKASVSDSQGTNTASGAPDTETAVFKPRGVTTTTAAGPTGGASGTAGTSTGTSTGTNTGTGNGGYQAGMGNVTQNATTPQNTLTNYTLSRAAGADRYAQAQNQWDAWQRATDPQYQAATRDALRNAAAGGALGSGMLNTSLGDLASNRALQMDTQKQNFLSQALTGSIEDAFRDVGIAQQQQGFQNNQQQQAFGNAMQSTSLQEALRSGAFSRALQALTAGSNQNPADVAMMLSQIFGGQASAAGNSLGALFAGMGQRSTSGGGSSNPYSSLWNSLWGNVGVPGSPQNRGTPTYPSGTSA